MLGFIRPCRLPRGVCDLFFAVVRHLPNSYNKSMLEYFKYEFFNNKELNILIQIVLLL